MRKLIDITGQKFGRLIVLSLATKWPESRTPRWLCLCDCGQKRILPSQNLREGNSRSCGCLAREEASKRHTTHGHTRNRRTSPEYTVYQNMMTRCYNPKSERFYRYGARGIKVSQRWLDSFENFLADMGPRPSPKHSLDRKEGDADYSKENCRWATVKEQQNNRSNNRFLVHNGERLTISQWAEKTGIRLQIISQRLGYGWSVTRALTEPPAQTWRRKAKP